MSLPTLRKSTPRRDIEIKQNATFSIGLTLIERDENGDAHVIDTDGWDAVLQVRREPRRDEPVLLEASTFNGRILTGIQGDGDQLVNIDIKLQAYDTAGLEYFGDAGFDLLCIEPGGDQSYVLAGKAFLSPAYSWEDD